jgi:rare lipoprotein A
MTALTLLLLSACAIAPERVSTLLPPGEPAVLPAPPASPPPVLIPAKIPPAPLPPDEITRPAVTAPQPFVATASTEPDYIPSFASYYAKRFEGRRTATGERYDPAKMTAATRDFPLHSWLKVINPANGREVIVRINDRTGKRKTPLVDLSRAAAKELGFLGKGKIRVHVIQVPPAP